jgi:hypothetical protein
MKKIISLIALTFGLAIPSFAQGNNPLAAFAVGGTLISTNLIYAVVPANGLGTPWVRFINATCDAAVTTNNAAATLPTSGAVRFYTLSLPPAYVYQAQSAASNTIILSAAYTVNSNDVVVLRHLGTNPELYERLVATTNINTTNISFTGNTINAYSAGDLFYIAKPKSAITVGNTTTGVSINGSGGPVWTGVKGVPILIDEGGTGTNNLYLHVTGTFNTP